MGKDVENMLRQVVSHKHERGIVKDEQAEKNICTGADYRSCFAWSDWMQKR